MARMTVDQLRQFAHELGLELWFTTSRARGVPGMVDVEPQKGKSDTESSFLRTARGYKALQEKLERYRDELKTQA